MVKGSPQGTSGSKDSGKRTRLTGIAGAVTAVGILAVAVVGNYEGLRLYTYKDVVGVWTYCYGETKGAKPGMKFTKEQCDVIFIESLTRHEQDMRRCLNAPDLIPEKSYVAFLSITYNIGGGNWCKSSMVRDINAGRFARACDDLLKYNKAKGRVLKGLTTRRQQERKLCLKGVAEGLPLPVEVAPIVPQPEDR